MLWVSNCRIVKSGQDARCRYMIYSRNVMDLSVGRFDVQQLSLCVAMQIILGLVEVDERLAAP